MKLALIGPTYPYRGGIAHYTTLLCKALRQRHQVLFCSFERQYPAWLFPGRTDRDPSEAPLKVDCEYLIDPLNPLSWWRTFRRIRREAPRMAIFQWWVPYWAPALASIALLIRKFTPAKVLFVCHNVMPHEGRLGDRCLTRLALRCADFCIVHSDEDRRRLRTLLPMPVVRKAALPTYEVFAETAPSPREARATLGLGEVENVLLFFGFVRPYKGLDCLLQAMPGVLRRVPAHLLIAGEFWSDGASHLAEMERLGLTDRVTIVDRYIPNEEVGLYFSAADVVVLPYVEATQSAVVQIAYGFHKPVITTSAGGLPESVEAGKTGLIVEPGDSEALSDAIVEFFDRGLAITFRENIRAIGDRFTWEKLVDLIEELAEA
jgi:glycosyltransferase involved in cell wall biosynthesis